MAIKWKNSSGSGKGILLIILCAVILSILMCNAYPLFRENAQGKIDESKRQYEEEQPSQETFEVDETYMRYLLSSIYYMNYETTPDMDASEYFTQNYDMSRLTGAEQQKVREASARLMKNMRNQYTTVQSMNNYASFAHGVERDFGTTGNLRNLIMGTDNYAKEYYESGIVISYDSRGIPNIRDSWGMTYNETELLGYLLEASMSRLMEDNGMEYSEVTYTEEYADSYVEDTAAVTETAVEMVDSYEQAESNDQLLRQIPLPQILNASFAFGIHGEGSAAYDDTWESYWVERNAYQTSGYMIGVVAILAVMALLALILQNVPALHLRENRLFCLPTELLAVAGFMGMWIIFEFSWEFGMYSMTDELVTDCIRMGFGEADGASTAAVTFVWLYWTFYALGCYWLTASLLPYITHPIRTLKENMLCSRFCRWLWGLWLRLWHWATDIELDEKLTRNIWKIVGLNGLIVALLCCIWFGGVVGALIYTVILYVLVKKKCSEIQSNYQKLLHVTKSIAEGELNTPTDEDMGLLNPIRDELAAIQAGFQKAVQEEVRSRNMKTELITNVSHDLKTPLTAIITYVDLLKKPDITEEERARYVETLDKKSQRLKVLIEDLFEVSKATTNNITMNFTDVDLVNLMKQVHLENEEKIAESTLDIRWLLPDEKCILTLDPQKTFRIMDNLLQNILKYSMPHSRVYIELKVRDDEVTVTFKNMSATEMNFSPEEITERFVRGDLSRNTEGSGLGLAIAQSFTELQNGTFTVEIDGDLFKVTLVWKKNENEK